MFFSSVRYPLVSEIQYLCVVRYRTTLAVLTPFSDKSDKESDGTEFADTIFLSDEDSGDRLEPVSHKENPENNDDEDDDEKKKGAKKDDDDDDHDDHALIKT
ncbi:hypothetical protein Tco_1196549 [Tanacetum coccineum]